MDTAGAAVTVPTIVAANRAISSASNVITNINQSNSSHHHQQQQQHHNNNALTHSYISSSNSNSNSLIINNAGSGSGSSSSNSSCSSSTSSNSSGYGSTSATPTNSYETHTAATTPVAIAEPTIIPIATVAAVSPYYSESISTQAHETQHYTQQHNQLQRQELPQHLHTQHQQHLSQLQENPQDTQRQQYYSSYDYSQQQQQQQANHLSSTYNDMGTGSPAFDGNSSTSTTGLPYQQSVTHSYKNVAVNPMNYDRQLSRRSTTSSSVGTTSATNYPQSLQPQLQNQTTSKPTAHTQHQQQQFLGVSGSSSKSRASSLLLGSSSSSTSTTAKPQAAATPFFAQPLSQQSSNTSTLYDQLKPKMPLDYHDNYANFSNAAAYHQQQKYYAAAKSQLKESVAYGAPPGLAGKPLYHSSNNFYAGASAQHGGALPTPGYDKYMYPGAYPSIGYETSQEAPYRKASAGSSLNASSWPWGIEYASGNSRTIPPSTGHLPTATVAPTHANYLAANASHMAREPYYMAHDKYGMKYDKYPTPYQQPYVSPPATRHHVWPGTHAPINERLAPPPPPHALHAPTPYFAGNAPPGLNSRQSCCAQPYQPQSCYYPPGRLTHGQPPPQSSAYMGSQPTAHQQSHLSSLSSSCKYGGVMDYGTASKLKNPNDLYLSTPYDANPPPSHIQHAHSYQYGSAAAVANSQLYSQNQMHNGQQPAGPLIAPHGSLANTTAYTNDLSLSANTYDNTYLHEPPSHMAASNYAPTAAKRALLDYRKPLQQPAPPSHASETCFVEQTGSSASRDNYHESAELLNTPETTTAFNEYDAQSQASGYTPEADDELQNKSNEEEKKNVSLRDFIANWNDDEEDYAVAAEDMSFAQSTVINEVLQASNSEASPPANLDQIPALIPDKRVVNSVSKVVEIVKHFADTPGISDADPNQYVNLPDIVIDTEKSTVNINSSITTPPDSDHVIDASSLMLDNFDVEKELDQLQQMRKCETESVIVKPNLQTDSDSATKTDNKSCSSEAITSKECEPQQHAKNLTTQISFDDLNLEQTKAVLPVRPIITATSDSVISNSTHSEQFFKDMEAYDSGNSHHSNESSLFEKEYETFINKITTSCETVPTKPESDANTEPLKDFEQNVKDFSKFHKRKRKSKDEVAECAQNVIQQNKKKLKVADEEKVQKSNFPQVYTKKSRNRQEPVVLKRLQHKKKPSSAYYKLIHSLRRYRLQRFKRVRNYITNLKEKHLPLIKRQSIKNYSIVADSEVDFFNPLSLTNLVLSVINSVEYRERIVIPVIEETEEKHICVDPACETCEVIRSLMEPDSYEDPILEGEPNYKSEIVNISNIPAEIDENATNTEKLDSENIVVIEDPKALLRINPELPEILENVAVEVISPQKLSSDCVNHLEFEAEKLVKETFESDDHKSTEIPNDVKATVSNHSTVPSRIVAPKGQTSCTVQNQSNAESKSQSKPLQDDTALISSVIRKHSTNHKNNIDSFNQNKDDLDSFPQRNTTDSGSIMATPDPQIQTVLLSQHQDTVVLQPPTVIRKLENACQQTFPNELKNVITQTTENAENGSTTNPEKPSSFDSTNPKDLSEPTKTFTAPDFTDTVQITTVICKHETKPKENNIQSPVLKEHVRTQNLDVADKTSIQTLTQPTTESGNKTDLTVKETEVEFEKDSNVLLTEIKVEAEPVLNETQMHPDQDSASILTEIKTEDEDSDSSDSDSDKSSCSCSESSDDEDDDKSEESQDSSDSDSDDPESVVAIDAKNKNKIVKILRKEVENCEKLSIYSSNQCDENFSRFTDLEDTECIDTSNKSIPDHKIDKISLCIEETEGLEDKEIPPESIQFTENKRDKEVMPPSSESHNIETDYIETKDNNIVDCKSVSPNANIDEVESSSSSDSSDDETADEKDSLVCEEEAEITNKPICKVNEDLQLLHESNDISERDLSSLPIQKSEDISIILEKSKDVPEIMSCEAEQDLKCHEAVHGSKNHHLNEEILPEVSKNEHCSDSAENESHDSSKSCGDDNEPARSPPHNASNVSNTQTNHQENYFAKSDDEACLENMEKLSKNRTTEDSNENAAEDKDDTNDAGRKAHDDTDLHHLSDDSASNCETHDEDMEVLIPNCLISKTDEEQQTTTTTKSVSKLILNKTNSDAANRKNEIIDISDESSEDDSEQSESNDKSLETRSAEKDTESLSFNKNNTQMVDITVDSTSEDTYLDNADEQEISAITKLENPLLCSSENSNSSNKADSENLESENAGDAKVDPLDSQVPIEDKEPVLAARKLRRSARRRKASIVDCDNDISERCPEKTLKIINQKSDLESSGENECEIGMKKHIILKIKNSVSITETKIVRQKANKVERYNIGTRSQRSKRTLTKVSDEIKGQSEKNLVDNTTVLNEQSDVTKDATNMNESTSSCQTTTLTVQTDQLEINNIESDTTMAIPKDSQKTSKGEELERIVTKIASQLSESVASEDKSQEHHKKENEMPVFHTDLPKETENLDSELKIDERLCTIEVDNSLDTTKTNVPDGESDFVEEKSIAAGPSESSNEDSYQVNSREQLQNVENYSDLADEIKSALYEGDAEKHDSTSTTDDNRLASSQNLSDQEEHNVDDQEYVDNLKALDLSKESKICENTNKAFAEDSNVAWEEKSINQATLNVDVFAAQHKQIQSDMETCNINLNSNNELEKDNIILERQSLADETPTNLSDDPKELVLDCKVESTQICSGIKPNETVIEGSHCDLQLSEAVLDTCKSNFSQSPRAEDCHNSSDIDETTNISEALEEAITHSPEFKNADSPQLSVEEDGKRAPNFSQSPRAEDCHNSSDIDETTNISEALEDAISHSPEFKNADSLQLSVEEDGKSVPRTPLDSCNSDSPKSPSDSEPMNCSEALSTESPQTAVKDSNSFSASIEKTHSLLSPKNPTVPTSESTKDILSPLLEDEKPTDVFEKQDKLSLESSKPDCSTPLSCNEHTSEVLQTCTAIIKEIHPSPASLQTAVICETPEENEINSSESTKHTLQSPANELALEESAKSPPSDELITVSEMSKVSSTESSNSDFNAEASPITEIPKESTENMFELTKEDFQQSLTDKEEKNFCEKSEELHLDCNTNISHSHEEANELVITSSPQPPSCVTLSETSRESIHSFDSSKEDGKEQSNLSNTPKDPEVLDDSSKEDFPTLAEKEHSNISDTLKDPVSNYSTTEVLDESSKEDFPSRAGKVQSKVSDTPKDSVSNYSKAEVLDDSSKEDVPSQAGREQSNVSDTPKDPVLNCSTSEVLDDSSKEDFPSHAGKEQSNVSDTTEDPVSNYSTTEVLHETIGSGIQSPHYIPVNVETSSISETSRESSIYSSESEDKAPPSPANKEESKTSKVPQLDNCMTDSLQPAVLEEPVKSVIKSTHCSTSTEISRDSIIDDTGKFISVREQIDISELRQDTYCEKGDDSSESVIGNFSACENMNDSSESVIKRTNCSPICVETTNLAETSEESIKHSLETTIKDDEENNSSEETSFQQPSDSPQPSTEETPTDTFKEVLLSPESPTFDEPCIKNDTPSSPAFDDLTIPETSQNQPPNYLETQPSQVLTKLDIPQITENIPDENYEMKADPVDVPTYVTNATESQKETSTLNIDEQYPQCSQSHNVVIGDSSVHICEQPSDDEKSCKLNDPDITVEGDNIKNSAENKACEEKVQSRDFIREASPEMNFWNTKGKYHTLITNIADSSKSPTNIEYDETSRSGGGRRESIETPRSLSSHSRSQSITPSELDTSLHSNYAAEGKMMAAELSIETATQLSVNSNRDSQLCSPLNDSKFSNAISQDITSSTGDKTNTTDETDFIGFKNQSSFEDESDFHGFEDRHEEERIRREIENLNDDSAANDAFSYAPNVVDKSPSLNSDSTSSELNELEALEKELSQHRTKKVLGHVDKEREHEAERHLVSASNVTISTNDIEHIKKMLESDEEQPIDETDNQQATHAVTNEYAEKYISSTNICIIPKLSDLCRAALNSSLNVNNLTVVQSNEVEVENVAHPLQDTANNGTQACDPTAVVERELSVEEALAEMYRQAGVLLSDPEDNDADKSATPAATKTANEEAQDVLLINLHEILNSDNDVFVLQCDMKVNDNNTAVANSSGASSNGSNTTTERVNTLQLIGILNRDRENSEIHIISSDSESEVIILSDCDTDVEFQAPAAATPFEPKPLPRDYIPFIDDLDTCDSLSDLSTIHHEEIVPDNIHKFLQEEFYKYLHEKYAQKKLSKYYHANRVLRKYKKRVSNKCRR